MNRQKDDEQESGLSPVESWSLLFLIIGIIPWIIFCLNTVLPAIGIHSIPMGFAVILAIAPPLLLWRAVAWLDDLRRS